MHLQLDRRTADVDVSADALSLAFHATPGLQVVATIHAPLAAPGLTARLEVLAASHRVRLLAEGVAVATEQVACIAGAAHDPLPPSAVHRSSRHELTFRCDRPQLDAAGLATLAGRLRHSAAAEGALVVSFPGHDDALTAMRALADGWETWHLYPGPRPHAVRTRTRLRRTAT